MNCNQDSMVPAVVRSTTIIVKFRIIVKFTNDFRLKTTESRESSDVIKSQTQILWMVFARLISQLHEWTIQNCAAPQCPVFDVLGMDWIRHHLLLLLYVTGVIYLHAACHRGNLRLLRACRLLSLF